MTINLRHSYEHLVTFTPSSSSSGIFHPQLHPLATSLTYIIAAVASSKLQTLSDVKMASRRPNKNEDSSDKKTKPNLKNTPMPRPLEFLALQDEYRTMDFAEYPSARGYAMAFLKLRRNLHQKFGRPVWAYEDMVIFVSNVEQHSEWRDRMWKMIEIVPVTLEWAIGDLLRECGEDTNSLEEIIDLMSLD